MTDYTQYLTTTTKTVGVPLMIDTILDRLDDTAATEVRGWLANTDIDNSHCARAITLLAADLIDWTREVKPEVVGRWRRYNT